MAIKKRTTKFSYVPTAGDIKAKTICNDNDCFIYPLSLDNAGTRYKLQVYRPKKKNPKNIRITDEKVYESAKSGWYEKIFQLYHHLKKDYVKEKN